MNIRNALRHSQALCCAAVVVLIAVSGFVVWTVRRAFPQVEGDLTVV